MFSSCRTLRNHFASGVVVVASDSSYSNTRPPIISGLLTTRDLGQRGMSGPSNADCRLAIQWNSQQPVAAVIKEDCLRLRASLGRVARELRELRMGAQ
jgi:hypothetical protein